MKASAPTPPMDFFNRIVVKASGAESAIAPRLPSLFEPVAGVDMALATTIEEPATPVAARELQDQWPVPMPPCMPGVHELRSLAPRHVETVEQGDNRVPTEPDRRVHAAEAAPLASLQPLPAVSGIVARAAAGPDEQQPPGKPKLSVRRIDKTGLGRTQESNSKGPGPEPEGMHQGSGMLIPKQAAVPARYPAAMAVSRAGSPTTRDFAANAPMAEQPAPVINVTIGRVEVRAVQASPGKPRIEPSRPKPLSLDDYLKQRGGNR